MGRDVGARDVEVTARSVGTTDNSAMPLAQLVQHFAATLCPACELHHGDPFCTGCAQHYFSPAVPRCHQCALPLPPAATDRCGQCLRQPPAFDATHACAHYGAPVNAMVLALKTGGRLALARAFGRLLAQRVPDAWIENALIVPVPLAYERQRERGFNQSHEIARAFAAARGLTVRTDVLVRSRHTPPQQHLKLDERRRNLRHAFAVHAPVHNAHVLIIDDVMTTGSTLNEIAHTLKRAGCARVTNLVVARTA